MSEIKKGDWVYYAGEEDEEEDEEEEVEEFVFRCDGIDGGWIKNQTDIIMLYWDPRYCHRLEPLKPGDKLDVGDRVAVVGRSSDGDPELGSIHRIMMILEDGPICPVIDFTNHGRAMLSSELARLPDCAQDIEKSNRV